MEKGKEKTKNEKEMPVWAGCAGLARGVGI
jgi:hypothetical protein